MTDTFQLTKGQIRKLNALRSSLGDELGIEAFEKAFNKTLNVPKNQENYDFSDILYVFGDLPKAECQNERFDTIEIELHEKCRFTRQCKLKTSRIWPFGFSGGVTQMQLQVCDRDQLRKVTLRGRMTYDQAKLIRDLFHTLEDTSADEICFDLTKLDMIDAFGADALKLAELECSQRAKELSFVVPEHGIVARYLSWWEIV